MRYSTLFSAAVPRRPQLTGLLLGNWSDVRDPGQSSLLSASYISLKTLPRVVLGPGCEGVSFRYGFRIPSTYCVPSIFSGTPRSLFISSPNFIYLNFQASFPTNHPSSCDATTSARTVSVHKMNSTTQSVGSNRAIDESG